MKKLLFLIIICLPCFSFGQSDSMRIEQEKKEIAMEAKPVFINATALISELRDDVKLAKQGLIKKSDVIKRFNETVGGYMKPQTTFAGVEKRLEEAGDAFPEFLFLKEQAKIAYRKAAEAKYEA